MAPADRGSTLQGYTVMKVNTHCRGIHRFCRGTHRFCRGTLAGGEEIRVPLACT